jgi:hypothetical protein
LQGDLAPTRALGTRSSRGTRTLNRAPDKEGEIAGEDIAATPAAMLPTSVTVLLMASQADHPGLLNATDALKRHGYAPQTLPPSRPLQPDGEAFDKWSKPPPLRALGHLVVGVGEKWQGWPHRMQRYRDAADELAKRDALAVVVCADAYDALSLRDGAALAADFCAFDRPLLLSLERVCMGNCVSIRDWWRTDGKRHLAAVGIHTGRPPSTRYVNGGLLMGYAWAVRDLYDWMLKTGQGDDQIGLARYCLAHRDHWAPDIRGRIFKNKVFGETLDELDLNGQGAHFGHFPGMRDWSIRGYEQACRRLLGRASGMSSKNMGSPELLAVRIVVIVILAVAFAVILAFALLPRRWKDQVHDHFFPLHPRFASPAPAITPTPAPDRLPDPFPEAPPRLVGA